MEYNLMHVAFDAQGISTIEKFVLIALAYYANDATGECWPSQGTVANRCGLNRKTVNLSIKNLVKVWLVIPQGQRKRNMLTYKLNLACEQEEKGFVESKSSANMTHGPVTQGNNDLLPTVTASVTQGNNNLLPKVTQTKKKNKEEKKEFEQNRVDSYTPTKAENLSVGMNLPAPDLIDSQSLDWDEISKAAVRQLVSEGFSADEADARVKGELDEAKWHAEQRSKDGWKNLDGNIIKHPQKHTIGTLANLARKTKNLPPVTRAELDEVVDTNPQVAEWLFCGEEVDRFWTFLVCRNFRNSRGETISRWNLLNTLSWYADFRDNLERRRFRFGA